MKQEQRNGGGHRRRGGMSYRRFAAMIATSTIVMFGLMYFNTHALDHIEYSQTRMWMAVIMGATMAAVMIGFMWSLYPSRWANLGIAAVSILLFAGALWLVRSQATVGDISYLKAMIPHHSIAIMTSERAHIKDPEVRSLADRILAAQLREIAEMKGHIARLRAAPTSDSAPVLPSYLDSGAPPPAANARAGMEGARAGRSGPDPRDYTYPPGQKRTSD